MKRVLFLIVLLFSVVCYAAPPPENVSYPIADDVGYVVQDIQSVNTVAIELNVQEVTFVDIGNTIKNDVCFALMNEFSMLSDVSCREGVIMNKNILTYYNYRQNKQHSNYGYPFGADYMI